MISYWYSYLILIWMLSLTQIHSIRIRKYFGLQQQQNMEYLQAIIGSNLTMDCTIILESNDQLYSLKWFRLNNGTYYEFYSYISSPNQTVHYKHLPGIEIDFQTTDQKNGESLHLINVNPDTDGIYRCEIISDEMFQIDRKEFNLTILIPPMETPKILFSKKIFELGEHVQLKCFSGFTRPYRPQIKWILNKRWPLVESEAIIRNYWMNDIDYYDNQTLSINHWIKSNNKIESLATSNYLKVDRRQNLRWPNDTKIQSTFNHEDHDHQLKRNKNVDSKISFVDFILKHQHVSKRSNHFSVRCISTIETEFYPTSSASSSSTPQLSPQELDDDQVKDRHDVFFDGKSNTEWTNPLSTPIIEGLQDKYLLGDIVNVKCSLPSNRLIRNISVPNKRVQWTINGRKVDRSKAMAIKNDYKNGQSRLCFKLSPQHLDRNESFNLECTWIQKWVTNDDDDDANIANDQMKMKKIKKKLNGTISSDFNSTTIIQRIKDLVLTRSTTETLKSLGPVLIPLAVVMTVLVLG